MFSSFINQINDAIYIVDPRTGGFLDVNDAACNMLGYRHEELLGMTVPDICLSITDPDLWEMKLKEAKEKGHMILEGDQRRKDGSTLTVELNVKYISDDQKAYLTVIARDITDRKQTEKALEASEKKYRTIIETTSEGVWIIDNEAKTTFVNKRMAEMLGYTIEEMEGRGIYDFMDKEAKQEAERNFERRRQGIIEDHDFRFKKKDGSDIWTSLSTNPLTDDDGTFVGALGMVTDITERKKAEIALKEKSAQLNTIIESLPFDIFGVNESGTYFIQNSSSRRAWGDLVGKRPEDVAPDIKTLNLWLDNNRRAFSGEVLRNEVEFSSPDGKMRYYFNIITPVRDDRKTFGILIINIDITDRKLMEKEIRAHRDHLNDLVNEGTAELKSTNEKLQQEINERLRAEAEVVRASHMAALGELAAGVAHEINNPINGVINYSQILFNSSRDGSKESELARKIIIESDRVASIVHNLLCFARDGKEQKTPIQVHEILTNTVALSEMQLNKDGISLRLNIPEELSPIIVHIQQMMVVFLNIISNARYALNRKYNGTNGNKQIEIVASEKTVNASSSISIGIHDNGEGIPADIMDRIVHPFFSTKSSHVGTGLGLSISQSIINDHGGRLRVESREGEYTKVMIDLPLK